MRKKIILGNWKMNNLSSDVTKFCESGDFAKSTFECGISFPSIYLSQAKILTKKNPAFIVAAQNVYFEKSGAFTGEISVEMLKDLNISHVILGHSERRELFAETDILINKKVHACLKNNILPILCCGETLKQYESSKTYSVIKKQLTADLQGCEKLKNIEQIIIAYEPIWAIGTGKVATADYAEDVAKFIRSVLSEILGTDFSQKIRIQYGGSVKPDNIGSFLDKPNIDGALVGGASLTLDSFKALLKNGEK